jgi:hypothetical protein
VNGVNDINQQLDCRQAPDVKRHVRCDDAVGIPIVYDILPVLEMRKASVRAAGFKQRGE